MSWLDEIENEATLALEGNEALTEGYMDDLRMARVIRELIGFIEKVETFYPVEMRYWILNYLKSPDTKEIIDDLAKRD